MYRFSTHGRHTLGHMRIHIYIYVHIYGDIRSRDIRFSAGCSGCVVSVIGSYLTAMTIGSISSARGHDDELIINNVVVEFPTGGNIDSVGVCMDRRDHDIPLVTVSHRS